MSMHLFAGHSKAHHMHTCTSPALLTRGVFSATSRMAASRPSLPFSVPPAESAAHRPLDGPCQMRAPVPATGLCCLVGRRCCHLASCGCKAVKQVCKAEPASCIRHQPLQGPVSPRGCLREQQHLCAAECSADFQADFQKLCSSCVATEPASHSRYQQLQVSPVQATPLASCMHVAGVERPYSLAVGCGLHAFGCQSPGYTWVHACCGPQLQGLLPPQAGMIMPLPGTS